MSVIEAPTRTVGAPLEVEVPKTPVEAQVLELAADILETEGWCQGAFAAGGHRCAVGGIGAAMKRLVFERGDKAKARKRAEKALADLVRQTPEFGSCSLSRYYGHDRDAIVGWNDNMVYRKERVIQKMREAAASLTPRL